MWRIGYTISHPSWRRKSSDNRCHWCVVAVNSRDHQWPGPSLETNRNICWCLTNDVPWARYIRYIMDDGHTTDIHTYIYIYILDISWIYKGYTREKNGEMGKLGQDRLAVRWEAVTFLFNLVIWNVWLFLFEYLAKCFVEVVVIMFGFNEGRFCWGCFACYDFRFMFSVCSLSLMFYVVRGLGLFCP